MRIAVVSDEISDDFEEAVQLGLLLGLTDYELRWVRPAGALQRLRSGDLSAEQAAELAAVAQRYGVAIRALSPGLFNCPWDGSGPNGQLERLERSFRLAEQVGARDILIDGFMPAEGRRNGICPLGVIDALGEAAARARAQGFRLLLRNAPGCYSDTGAHTASIVHAVHSPALAVSWDPCHAARAGEAAVAEGYEWVAPFVADVRVKDQARRDGLGYEYTILHQGSLDWPAQLEALGRDGFQGTLTLGAQFEPRLLNTMHSLEALRRLLQT